MRKQIIIDKQEYDEIKDKAEAFDSIGSNNFIIYKQSHKRFVTTVEHIVIPEKSAVSLIVENHNGVIEDMKAKHALLKKRYEKLFERNLWQRIMNK